MKANKREMKLEINKLLEESSVKSSKVGWSYYIKNRYFPV